MEFIDTYKRLEKICGEIFNDVHGVSAYIDAMINLPEGAYLVNGWSEDLNKLKHYRWVRNQIVHEPNCTEENMCSDEDTSWLLAFYARIINHTDPLALHRKAKRGQQHQGVKPTSKQYAQEQDAESNPASRRLVTALTVLVAIAFAAIMVLLLMR